MSKEIFKKVIRTVLVEMDKALAANLKEIKKFAYEMKSVQWKSLGYVGAKGLVDQIQEKHLFESSLTVVVVGGEKEVDGKNSKTYVLSISHESSRHEFWVDVQA